MVTEEVAGLVAVVEDREDIRPLIIHFCLGNKIYIISGRAIGLGNGDRPQARNNPPPKNRAYS